MKAFIGHIRFSALLFPAVAALLLSCGKLQPSGGNGGDSGQDGDATVQIVISSAPDTRSAKDGDVMKNLRVWMVDGSNKVSEYASSTNTGEVTFSDDAKTATVTFSDVVRGDYTLYLLANDATSLISYVRDNTIDDSFTKAALSLPSGSTTYPTYSDDAGMPLSLVKKVSVGPGVNRISAEIVRVCGQVNVTINNRTTDRPIYITGVSLSKRSPSSGYVFQQDDHSSPTGTTQSDLASNTTLTRLDPGKGSTMLSCYLFENCSGTDALSLSIAGGIYDKVYSGAPTTTDVTVSSYKATGDKKNIAINTSNYYFLASASNPIQFLMADSDDNLTIDDVGSDDELFVKDDVASYLWQFSSTDSPSIKNIGKNTYINITANGSSASYSLGSSSQNLSTSTATGRQFYYYYYYYYYYIYNNSGKIGITESSTSTSSAVNTGWYLREATSYTYTKKKLSPDPLYDFMRTVALTYTDSYGEVQPLTKVCRNDKVDIIVNLFYNPLTSSFDFQVEPWRTKTNQTTFD